MLQKILTKATYIVWLMRFPIVSVSILLSLISLNLSNATDYSGIIPLTLIIIAGYVQNDIYDVEIDRISASSRPIPSGHVTVNEARTLYACLVVIGLAKGMLLLNLPYFVYLIVVLLFFLIYTRFCKTYWLLKNGFTALTSTTVILIPLFFGHTLSKQHLSLCITAFFFTFGRELFMDVRDLSGDQTIPNVKRLPSIISLSASFILLLLSRIVRESMLSFSVERVVFYLLVSASFYFIVKKKKTIYWIISELLKIIFVIDLLILFFNTY